MFDSLSFNLDQYLSILSTNNQSIMADHKLRLRIASSFLLIVSFVLTFVFIITATGSTSESYGLTKITLDTADPESGVVTFTVSYFHQTIKHSNNQSSHVRNHHNDQIIMQQTVI